MKRYMSLKKWNHKRLLLRIATFPIKLLLQLTWGILSSIILSFKWLKNGSQEIVYGDDFSASIVRLIEQNEIIITKINRKETNKNRKNDKN